MGNVTWPHPFQGNFVRRLGLAMMNLQTKFEVFTLTCYKDIKGNAKCRNWDGLKGWGHPTLPPMLDRQANGHTHHNALHASPGGRGEVVMLVWYSHRVVIKLCVTCCSNWGSSSPWTGSPCPIYSHTHSHEKLFTVAPLHVREWCDCFKQCRFTTVSVRLSVRSYSSCVTLLVGRQKGHPACKKTEWLDAGMVICLGQGVDLHTVQLMSLPLTICCCSKSRLVLPSWFYLSGAGSPGQSRTKSKRV